MYVFSMTWVYEKFGLHDEGTFTLVGTEAINIILLHRLPGGQLNTCSFSPTYLNTHVINELVQMRSRLASRYNCELPESSHD